MKYLTFNKTYFLWTVLLFVTEVLIAKFLDDDFIRPYFGDFLVVMLIYCFVRTFFRFPVVPTLIGVLLFSYMIEMLQYIKIVKVLGLQNNKLASTVIGTSFAWMDIVAYTTGIIALYLVEQWREHRRSSQHDRKHL